MHEQSILEVHDYGSQRNKPVYTYFCLTLVENYYEVYPITSVIFWINPLQRGKQN